MFDFFFPLPLLLRSLLFPRCTYAFTSANRENSRDNGLRFASEARFNPLSGEIVTDPGRVVDR